VKYVQTKSRIALYVIIVLITMAVIIGCIYEKQQFETISERNETIHISNETKQQINNTIKTETDKEVDIQVAKPVNLGEFKLTAYCSCFVCCGVWANNRPNGIVYGAIGEELKEGYSIAVDPNVIPYNSEVIINGKTYEAQDCGGAIKENRIDIYFEDHNDALEFGVQYAEVFVKM
jgi:3D (Asp-Asp-Asp) domain-containing protein